jgi:hypothetical protein
MGLKTTNTLLAIITIILILFAAEHCMDLYSNYEKEQVEIKIWEINEKQKEKEMELIEQYNKTLDSLNNIDEQMYKKLK